LARDKVLSPTTASKPLYESELRISQSSIYHERGFEPYAYSADDER
jgi:hypothetical protein